MTYKKLILASGALAATTTAVRVTKSLTDVTTSAWEHGEELINAWFEFTGVLEVDIMLAALTIFGKMPMVPVIDMEEYFSGEKGILPMRDDMTEEERVATAIQNMVMAPVEPYVATIEIIDKLTDWYATEFIPFAVGGM